MKLAELGKPFRIFFTGASFVFFWSGGAVLSYLVLPIENMRDAPPAEKQRRSRHWVERGFRLFHDFMRLWGLTDYDPRKVDLELPEGPFVMIANHPTLVDVTALMSAVEDLSVVVKNDSWRVFVERLLELCGHIDGGDDSALAAGSTAVQALERLSEGQPVLIFPEGTRSPEDGLHPFQRGAFEVAKRAGVPIVPVMITADPAWLMKHQRWYEVPNRMNRMRIRPLPGIAVEIPTEKSKVLAARYHAAYKECLEAWLNKRRSSGMFSD